MVKVLERTTILQRTHRIQKTKIMQNKINLCVNLSEKQMNLKYPSYSYPLPRPDFLLRPPMELRASDSNIARRSRGRRRRPVEHIYDCNVSIIGKLTDKVRD